MNNPFEVSVGERIRKEFAGLLEMIKELRRSGRAEDRLLCRELDEGKMLGVLIAEDSEGVRHTLRAFSGQLAHGGFHHPDFVGPAFDYLQPEGYFKIQEAEISRLNLEIKLYAETELAEIRNRHDREKERMEREVNEYAEKCREAKSARAERRASGEADDAELAAMIRRSQFEKAELRRRKRRAAEELKPLDEQLQRAEDRLTEKKERRKRASEELQCWLFDNFSLLNAKGESCSLTDIFAETAIGVPPTGAGECCAPKLLQAAYLRGWRPVEIGEMWYGKPKDGEVRRHGEFYPACRGKCGPVLGWMLRGLEVDPPLEATEEVFGDRPMGMPEPKIIYEGERFCVVDKPAGMLSVRGKIRNKSVEEWLKERYEGREVKMVHRLDQDTSGLLLAAFDMEAYKTLQGMFARREIEKTYVADLEGDCPTSRFPPKGRISLPLSTDWLDRPRQRVDHTEGKEAVTDYEFISDRRIIFHPSTGRTHQLRVHAASEEGLGMPIVGDRLYGHPADRLHLHAWRLWFVSPFDGSDCFFQSSVPF